MRIIPAIDIIDGKCVRLTQGDYATKKTYNSNPLEVAKAFESVGVEYLHLVDLDGAKAGNIVNYKVLENLSTNTGLKIDFGGGLKSDDDLRIAFESGANEITAGSIAVKAPSKVESWIKAFGAEKIILGADVKDNKIAINGWQESTNEDIFGYVRNYIDKGIKKVISTDIATDGMLQGPSYALYEGLVEAFPQSQIVASGGVSDLSDLERLEAIGVDGAIVGKAIYENRITLKQIEDYVG